MKEGWEIKKLGEVVEVLDNLRKPITKGKRIEGEYPYYGATGILSYVHNYIFSEKLVLIGEDGAKWLSGDNTSFIAEGKYWVNNHAHVIRPNRKFIIDEWIVYFLNFSDLTPFITGMTVPKLNQEKMRSIPIPIPPIPEQQRIVTILDECFAAIDKAKANAEQNLKNARELFESYLQGVFENGKWEKKKWGDLCDFIRGPFGGSLKKEIFKEEGYVVYEQKHAIHDHFNQLRYFIDEDKFNEMKRFELFPGDIIMSCSGVTLGRVAIVPEGIKRGIINQALLKLTPKKNVSVDYIQYWLRSNIFQKIIFDFAGGAAIPNVPSAKILKDILIPLPDLNVQLKVVATIDALRVETQKLEAVYQQKVADLMELKKSVLERAFKGEL